MAQTRPLVCTLLHRGGNRAGSSCVSGPERVRWVVVHVIVVGCGRVGSGVALELVRTGHEVAVIDKRPVAFRRLPQDFKGTTIVGSGFDRDHLEQAGIRRAGALAAVTSGDNSNILCARIARENYEIESVVARIYDPRRAEIYQRLGIPTVATVTWTTDQVLRRLFPERAAGEWSDGTGSIQLVEHLLPAAWAGKSLSELERPGEVRVVLVTRAGAAQLVGPNLIGQEGDVLHAAVTASGRRHLDHLLDRPERELP